MDCERVKQDVHPHCRRFGVEHRVSHVSEHAPTDEAVRRNNTSALSWDMIKKLRASAAALPVSQLTELSVVLCSQPCWEVYSCSFPNTQGVQGAPGYPGELGPQGPPGAAVSMSLCLTCYFKLWFFLETSGITQMQVPDSPRLVWGLDTCVREIHILLLTADSVFSVSFDYFMHDNFPVLRRSLVRVGINFNFQIVTHKFTLNTNVINCKRSLHLQLGCTNILSSPHNKLW